MKRKKYENRAKEDKKRKLDKDCTISKSKMRGVFLIKCQNSKHNNLIM